jgi:hypothetical protein
VAQEVYESMWKYGGFALITALLATGCVPPAPASTPTGLLPVRVEIVVPATPTAEGC